MQGGDAPVTAVDALGSGNQVQRGCQEPAECKSQEEGGTFPEAERQELPESACRAHETSLRETVHGSEAAAYPSVSGENMKPTASEETITWEGVHVQPVLATSSDSAVVQSTTPSTMAKADHVSCDDLAQKCLGLS